MLTIDGEKNDDRRRSILATAWVFVLLNMVYADLLGMLRPGYLETLDRVSRELSAETVLFFALLMEVIIVMVLVSRILGRRTIRWATFLVVPLSILWVVVPAFVPSFGPTPLSYVFFATVETCAMLGILWYAWSWPEGRPEAKEL